MSPENETLSAADLAIRHRGVDFPHRDELAAAVAAGAPLVGYARAIPAPELAGIYRVRLAHLEDLRARAGDALDPVLRDDVYRGVRELVDALQGGSVAAVRAWSATTPDGRSFTLFEDAASGRPLTCIKAYDQRIRPYANGADVG